jgi:uncharacterized membrane protein YoaK (UPF0700 family)
VEGRIGATTSTTAATAQARSSVGFDRLTLLLLGLTGVTGLVDAFSFLLLGRVFVANMTGNVVFLAFGFAGTPGFSIPASLIGVGAFAAGAFVGGRLAARAGGDRLGLLARAVGLEIVLDAVALAVAARLDLSAAPTQYLLIALLAPAMGIQNAAARKLAVPDLTTTVLTLTITGLSADRPWLGEGSTRSARRVASVGSMFAGAVVGALLVLHVSGASVLLVALAILAGVAAAAARGFEAPS